MGKALGRARAIAQIRVIHLLSENSPYIDIHAMKQLFDLEPFMWIAEQLDPLRPMNDPAWQGNTVSHCLPKSFGAYCKLLHPLNQTTRWSELAKRFRIAFHAELSVTSFVPWPDALTKPDSGTLNLAAVTRLANLLAPLTHRQSCYFYYNLIATRSYERDLLYTGGLEEVALTFQLDTVSGSPSYWWPADRSWCICTDWDLTFSLIGGAHNVIATLLADPILECVTVTPMTRVDDFADLQRQRPQT